MRMLLGMLCVILAVAVAGCGSSAAKKATPDQKKAADEEARKAAEEKARQLQEAQEAKRRQEELEKKRLAEDARLRQERRQKSMEEIAEQRRVDEGEAKVLETRKTIEDLATAIGLFRFDHNRYPKALLDLMVRPADVPPELWENAYFDRPMKDAWGHNLEYRLPGPGENPYIIISFGEDGKEGGKEFKTDLTSAD